MYIIKSSIEQLMLKYCLYAYLYVYLVAIKISFGSVSLMSLIFSENLNEKKNNMKL